MVDFDSYKKKETDLRRVVISGMGVISPVGNDIETFWENLKKGMNGIDEIKRFDASRLPVHMDAEVKDFDPSKYYAKKPDIRKTDLFMQYAMGASCDAVNDSGILDSNLDHDRFGVYLGTGIGGINTFLTESQKLIEKGPEWISPFFIPMLIGNMAAGSVSIRFEAKGPVLPVTTACATSTHAIGEAFHAISAGYADAIIAGGAEAAISEIGMAGFVNCKALNLSDKRDEASLPFDARRGGFVMGEGAGVIILEELEHAKARNAKIYAEITGYGNTSDAYHITAPNPSGEGAKKVIELAMKEAGVKTDEIAYVNAHGTGTKLNDAMETQALKAIYGDKVANVHISSTKSMTGHMLGAAGAVECIASVLALKDGIIPPTINYKEADPECDLDYTPNKALEVNCDLAMSTSFGFGGHNACIVIRPYRG